MTTDTIKHIYAHSWDILGDDRIPRWPSAIGEKRRLKVVINSWTTAGDMTAKHWYATVEEEENQWWCEVENAWVTLSCDSGRHETKMRAEMLTPEDAIEMALKFVELVAGKGRRKHRVTWEGPGKPRWARPS